MCAYFQHHRASYTVQHTITNGPACCDTHTHPQSVHMLYTIHFFPATCVYLCDSLAWFRYAFHVKLIWLQWCGKELLDHSFPFHSHQMQSVFFSFIWTSQTMKQNGYQQQNWIKYWSVHFLFRFSLIVRKYNEKHTHKSRATHKLTHCFYSCWFADFYLYQVQTLSKQESFVYPLGR